MAPIKLNHSSGVPIFRQIYDQILYLIEAGQLTDGDRLPSSRMLSSNLHVNRNTVARAYAELRDGGYIESHRRNGMLVTGAEDVRRGVSQRQQAQGIISEAVERCFELGLSADQIASIAYHESLHGQRAALRLLFVECNGERAESFASDLSGHTGMPIDPLVLGQFDSAELSGADLVITTFFHLAEVRGLARSLPEGPEVLAIVVAPHVRTLVKLAQIPKGRRIGILYNTPDQSESMRQSLTDTGLDDVVVLESGSKQELAKVDLLVIPSESPELLVEVGDAVPVVEFGNVLDAASVRMVNEVLDDVLRRRQHHIVPQ